MNICFLCSLSYMYMEQIDVDFVDCLILMPGNFVSVQNRKGWCDRNKSRTQNHRDK